MYLLSSYADSYTLLIFIVYILCLSLLITFIFEYILPLISKIFLYVLCFNSFLITLLPIPFAVLFPSSLSLSINILYILLLNPINSIIGFPAFSSLNFLNTFLFVLSLTLPVISLS